MVLSKQNATMIFIVALAPNAPHTPGMGARMDVRMHAWHGARLSVEQAVGDDQNSLTASGLWF